MPTGDSQVIEALNDVLAAELVAINQYMVHAEMCSNWGYQKLHNRIRKEAIDEMRHAEALIERVLFLEGVPNVQNLGKVRIGENIPEMLRADLNLELEALPRLNESIATCVEKGDNGSRELFERILKDEEMHTDWLEAQLDQIEQVGLQNYLAAQIVNEQP
jgi:bacterioferritin